MPSHKNIDNNRSKFAEWLSSLKQFLRLGVAIILLGLLLIFISLFLEEQVKPLTHWAEIGLNFLSHLGIAFLILGIIGVLIDLPDWQKYFQERIRDTIIEKEYLNKLDNHELMNLVTNALKSYFKVEDIDEKESFLEYFQSKILGFIASPYREDTHGIVRIEYSAADDTFVMDDHTSYRCRKVGRFIQSDVQWAINLSEIKGDIQDFKVILRVPQNFFQSPDFVTKYPDVSDGRLVFNKDDERLKKIETAEETGYILSLSDFKEIDGLSVTVDVTYAVPTDRFLTWEIIHPTKGFLFTINYPKELELHPYLFGFDRSTVEEKISPGLYSLRSDSWLLPNDGLAYQLLRGTPVNSSH